MIARVWHGWALARDAPAYEAIFRDVVAPHLRRLTGFRGAWLLRGAEGGEVEFTAVTLFTSLDAIREFAGDDCERAVVSPEARRVLARFDDRCRHYEVAAAVSATDGVDAQPREGS